MAIRSRTGRQWHNQLLHTPLRSDLLRLALLALTVLSLSRLHQHFAFLGAMRLALLLFMFASVYALLNMREIAPKNILDAWPGKVVVGLVIVAMLSVPFGISMGRSGKFIIENYSKTIVFALLLMAAIRTPRELKYFVWAYVISAAILAWLAIFVFSPISDGPVSRLNDLYTYDANDLGLVLVVALPLTLLVFQSSGPKAKFFSALVLIGIGVSIARTGSRGAFLGFIGVGAALILSLGHVSIEKRLAFVVIAFFSLAFAAPKGYWDQMRTLKIPTADYNWTSVDGRKELALRGMDYMLDYPLFGLGISNSSMAEGTISSKARERIPGTGLRWTAAHNSYVQIGAELGVSGLLLWLMLVWGGPISMLVLRGKIPKEWAKGNLDQRFLYFAPGYIAVAMIGFAITSLFVSFAYLDPVYILAAYMAALYAIVRSAGRQQPARMQPRSRRGRPLVSRSRRHPAPEIRQYPIHPVHKAPS